MANCDVCGAQEAMPYRCHLCGGTHCSAHRLPENHDCPGLDSWGDPSGVFDSGFDDSVSNPSQSAGSVAASLGLDTGAGGLLGYFRGNMTYTFLGLMWVTFLLQWLVLFVSPSLFETLFVLSPNHIEYAWTWVTSIFAHGGFSHIAINSIVLYFFGPLVERRMGSRKFAALFLISGATAGLAQVGTGLLLGEAVRGVVGASGAIMAIMGVLTVLNPNLRVYLYFILPMPLWLLTIGFAAFSVLQVAVGGALGGNVAHFAHLAGLFIGLGYGEKMRREGERAPQQLQFGGSRGPGRRRF